MWVFTPEGFVSIVEKNDDQGRDTLTVRARNATALSAFALRAGRDEKRYRVNMATDYPYRDTFTRREVGTALLSYISNVTYSNFKNEAMRVAGKTYATVLGRIWSAGLSLEDKGARKHLQARGAQVLADDDGPTDEDDWASIMAQGPEHWSND